MPANSSNFTGDVPAQYDTGLGPNLFEDFADLLVQRCRDPAPSSVAEIAAGTGIVSRKLRDSLPPGARLVVTDLNPPMLDVARSKFSRTDRVEFAIADAGALPFGDAAFDLMVCQFGVMFFPDKVASYREAARVLRPGGHYVFNVWSSMARNPFALLAHEVCAAFFPADPPGFYKVPFHYGDPGAVRADLADAGWRDITHETTRLNKEIADPRAFATALVFGNPLADEIRGLGGVDPGDVAAVLLGALHRRFGPAPLIMPLEATTFVCRAP